MNDHGDLVAECGSREFRWLKPRAYQEIDGARREVVARYVLVGHDSVRHLFYEEYLGLTTPHDGEIVEVSDSRWVTRWWNHCPTLEVCQALGLDTREICRQVFQRPVERLLARIDPRLRLDLSLFDFSDRNFQREYLKDVYQEERDPETYAYLRYRDRTDFASLSVKYRMDSFRMETVELPEGAFRRIGAQAPPGLLPPWILDGLTWSLDARAGGYEPD